VLVIFLDVDGVLNSERFLLKLEAQHHAQGHTRETECGCLKLRHQLDRDAIARLNRIVAVTGAKIVVSSTWRKLFDLSELLQIFVAHGLLAEIVGATPEGHKEPGFMEMYGHPTRLPRGYEIDYWLKAHPEVERFVILDDDSDMAMHRHRLVQTDFHEGLLDDHADLAIRVLAWDGSSKPTPFEQWQQERST